MSVVVVYYYVMTVHQAACARFLAQYAELLPEPSKYSTDPPTKRKRNIYHSSPAEVAAAAP